ncbi:hypothetical protein BDN67DRAFT_967891 [Paxillus ammoniavirescens]|nr:hypothetical protein BDN67DRAFT_967891 [Paxillus ammoniavirescens]
MIMLSFARDLWFPKAPGPMLCHSASSKVSVSWEPWRSKPTFIFISPSLLSPASPLPSKNPRFCRHYPEIFTVTAQGRRVWGMLRHGVSVVRGDSRRLPEMVFGWASKGYRHIATRLRRRFNRTKRIPEGHVRIPATGSVELQQERGSPIRR